VSGKYDSMTAPMLLLHIHTLQKIGRSIMLVLFTNRVVDVGLSGIPYQVMLWMRTGLLSIVLKVD